MTGSCFVERLGHYLRLTDGEQSALSRLEGQERVYRRGTLIRQEHERSSELFVVHSGWLLKFVLLNDGTRQILRLHLPGELVGLSCLAFPVAVESLCAATDVRVSVVDRTAMWELFADHPRLAVLISMLEQVERVATGDRLASVARSKARARVAALILDTICRLRLINRDTESSFVLPLTQEEIGDATGLTAVHVNRMVRSLVDDGLIRRSGHHITILDEPRLGEVAGFVNRYAAVDSTWLPSLS